MGSACHAIRQIQSNAPATAYKAATQNVYYGPGAASGVVVPVVE
jgi:hypothetical protein